MRSLVILLIIFPHFAAAIVFLNTTDASDQSDQEIFKDNIELPHKINALIEEEKKLTREKRIRQDSLNETPRNLILDQDFHSDSIYHGHGTPPLTGLLEQNRTIDSMTEARFSLVLGASRKLIDYNLGVLKSIEEYGFPLVSIGGSGWGGVVAILYSAGYAVNDIQIILQAPESVKASFSTDYALIGHHARYQLQLEEEAPRLERLESSHTLNNIDEFQLSLLLSKVEKEVNEGYDSLQVPVFTNVSDFKAKGIVVLQDNRFVKNIVRSLYSSQSDSLNSNLQYFDGEFYASDIERSVGEAYNSKVLMTKLSDTNQSKMTLLAKLKKNEKSLSSRTQLHLSYSSQNTEISALNKGYIDFSNRLSSLYRIGPKHKMDWQQKPKIYQDQIIFKGLDLESIPSQYHRHIQSFFPSLKNDETSFQEIQTSLERLTKTNIYRNLKALYIYDNYLRAYRLEIRGDVISPIQYGAGFIGSSFLGAGLGLYYSQKWVSQMLFDWKNSMDYTEAHQSIYSRLNMKLGAHSEWELMTSIKWENWSLNDTWNAASPMDIWEVKNTSAHFGFHKNEMNAMTWGAMFKFTNTSMTTESTVSAFTNTPTPLRLDPAIDFEGLFVDLELQYKGWQIILNSGTQSQIGLGETKNPLLIQPNLIYSQSLSLSQWSIKPKLQIATSATYESIIDQTYLYRQNFTDAGGKLIDPIIDTLMRQKVQIGQLSNLLWDSRYYAHSFFTLELPIKYTYTNFFNNWSWNTNLMATFLYDQPSHQSSREWYAIENYIAYESAQNSLIMGQELSFYKKWREKSSETSKWFVRVGLCRF